MIAVTIFLFLLYHGCDWISSYNDSLQGFRLRVRRICDLPFSEILQAAIEIQLPHIESNQHQQENDFNGAVTVTMVSMIIGF